MKYTEKILDKDCEDLKKDTKLRNVVFTAWEKPPEFDNEKFNYMIYKKEKCSKTGKLHYQGYVEFLQQIRFSVVKKLLGNTTYIAARRGKQCEAIAYVKKEETKVEEPIEFGRPKAQGTEKGLLKIADDIADGITVKEIAKENPELFIKFHKGIEKLRDFHLQDKSYNFRDVNVTLLLGNKGTGKTQFVTDKHGAENIYKYRCDKNDSCNFDKYDGEKVLLIDDFYGTMPIGLLLKLCDGYQLPLNVKGSTTFALFEHVYITSNHDYKQWYDKWADDDEPTLQAFESRINTIFRFTGEDLRRKRKGKLDEIKINDVTTYKHVHF